MTKRTKNVLDDELVDQASKLARVTTKKKAAEVAITAHVRKPNYSLLLALPGMGLIDPEYDPRGLYGLTKAGLERRGLIAK